MNKFGVLLAVGLFEAACSTSHDSRAATDPAPAQVPAVAVTPAPAGAATPAADAGASAPAALPQASLPPPPPRAGADFARALELVRAGKD